MSNPSARMNGLPQCELPRERLVRNGARALASAELLAVVLQTGRRGVTAVELGSDLLARFGLRGIARSSAQELAAVNGCGPAKAARVLAAIELGRRAMSHSPPDQVRISSPSDAAVVLSADMSLLEQEHLRIILLNTKNRLLAIHEVYKGSVNTSQVRVAEVFREAVRRNSPSIIVAHNHPSGDPAPSLEDVHVTRQIVEAGQLLDIDVLDHIIIGHHGWVSLRERGLGFG